jgi:hypothetical protein
MDDRYVPVEYSYFRMVDRLPGYGPPCRRIRTRISPDRGSRSIFRILPSQRSGFDERHPNLCAGTSPD